MSQLITLNPAQKIMMDAVKEHSDRVSKLLSKLPSSVVSHPEWLDTDYRIIQLVSGVAPGYSTFAAVLANTDPRCTLLVTTSPYREILSPQVRVVNYTEITEDIINSTLERVIFDCWNWHKPTNSYKEELVFLSKFRAKQIVLLG